MANRTCTECGRERRPGTGAKGLCVTCYSRKWRAVNERKSLTYPINCEFCGEPHNASRPEIRFCSVACSKRHAAGWSTSTALATVPPPPKPQRTPPPSPARTEWWQLIVQGPCRHCGSQFTAVAASQCSAPQFCSDRCARAASKARRRATQRNAYVADINRRDIFERDHWRCQLCSKPVAKRQTVPHPKAPVIDHIVPLAAGGTHEPANAQCAHFLCNSRKSDGAANDQLRLLG